VQEAHRDAGDVLVFRFWMDKGKTYPITDTLVVGGKTLAIKTSDDATFSVASGFDSTLNAHGIGDGSRFTVDATVSYASLGVSPGGKLTGFTVTSKSSSGDGDFMPGGCHNTLGDCVDTGGQSGTQYIAGGGSGSYTLRGTGYYLDLTGPSGTQAAQLGQDLSSPIMLNLANKFHRLDQTVTLTVSGADGVTAGFHSGDPSGASYKAPLTVKVNGDSGTILHLNLHGDRAGATGTLTITATSDLGGVNTVQVPYEVKQSSGATDATSGTGATDGQSTTDAGNSSKGSPAPAAPLAGLLLLALALRRRA
jgi:hypothetical protein